MYHSLKIWLQYHVATSNLSKIHLLSGSATTPQLSAIFAAPSLDASGHSRRCTARNAPAVSEANSGKWA